MCNQLSKRGLVPCADSPDDAGDVHEQVLSCMLCYTGRSGKGYSWPLIFCQTLSFGGCLWRFLSKRSKNRGLDCALRTDLKQLQLSGACRSTGCFACSSQGVCIPNVKKPAISGLFKNLNENLIRLHFFRWFFAFLWLG